MAVKFDHTFRAASPPPLLLTAPLQRPVTSRTAGISPASRIAAQLCGADTRSPPPLLLLLPLLPLCSLSHTHAHTHTRSEPPSCLRSYTLSAEMAGEFVGTWNLLKSENFDEYMKELGECCWVVVVFLCFLAFRCLRMRV